MSHKIWLESIKSLSQVLSHENQELLKPIVKYKLKSLAELEEISHRKKSNLSRILKTLKNYGIISLNKENGKVISTVKAIDLKVEFGLNLTVYQ